MDPRVNVAEDVAAINRGEGVRDRNTFTVDKRTNGRESSGTLYPMTGDGFHQLSRGASAALGVYRTIGFTEQAERVLGSMHNVGPDERVAARLVIVSIVGED